MSSSLLKINALLNCPTPATDMVTAFDLKSIGHFNLNLSCEAFPVKVSVLDRFANSNVPVVLSNLTPRCVDLVTPFPKTAFAVAYVPVVLPDNVIVGVDMYPLPSVSTLILVTFPFLMNAVAVAPDPPPPVIVTFGALI